MKMQKMKICLGMLVLAANFILVPAVVNAECRLYQHRDYRGSLKRMNNSYLIMKRDPTPNIGTTTNGHAPDYFYDATWNDQVSSFKVDGGCTLTLWEDFNKGGMKWVTKKSYSFVGSKWNDEVSEALCSCP